VAKEQKPRLTKEDVDARFTSLQALNQERRENKVTREDVEQHFANRKATKAERSVPGQRTRVVSLGLGIALLVGSGALGLTVTNSTTEYTRVSQATQQEIEMAQDTLKAIPANDEESTAQYTATLDAQISDATTKGEEIARLQQEFTTILFQGNGVESADGAPNTALIQSAEHRRLLAPFFVEKALLAPENQAYAPGSAQPFDEGRIDPRFAWYVGYDPASNGLAGNWSLSSQRTRTASWP
jgi:hypothetical protein